MTMTTSGTGRRTRGTAPGLVFVGILLIGLAVGILTGEVAVAVLGALGLAFLASALTGDVRGTMSAGGMAFSGCLFAGIALGLFFGNAAVGVLAGLGCGFILMYLVGHAGDEAQEH